MKHWTVQKVVSAGFSFVILLSVIICAFSLFRMESIQRHIVQLKDDAMPGIFHSTQISERIWEFEATLRKVVLSEDAGDRTAGIARMEAIIRENRISFEERAKTISGAEEERMFKALEQNRADYLNAALKVLEYLKEGKNKEALAWYEQKGVPSFATYSENSTKMEANDKHHVDLALLDIAKAVRETNQVTLLGSAISLVLCIAAAVAVLRMLGSTLKSLMLSLIQVNGSATEMAATLKEQQASANEVASTSVEIGATAKEISATTKELGKTMSDVAAVSEQTAELATGGQAGLSRLEQTMKQIMGATASISGKLAILNEKTANINSMVTTINKVADQTNLLSLNAAIEAEKAGEYGQGFAVVATEIRRLADQTAVATYDIEQMVKEMQSAVSAGVMGMDKFAEEVRRGNEEVCGVTVQLAQIIQQVQALTPRFESVNEGMQMQTTAAGQISDALTQLGDTAQQSAQALRQNGEAIEQLMKAAQGLQTAAAQLKSVDA